MLSEYGIPVIFLQSQPSFAEDQLKTLKTIAEEIANVRTILEKPNR